MNTSVKHPGTLYLIPSVISEGTENNALPQGVYDQIKPLRYFLAEDLRTARRFLSGLKIYMSVEDLQFQVLNKDTKVEEIPELMRPILLGHSMGILSESGCPAIADPGSLAVAYAHQYQITVIPLVGPSSILLAMMGSGLNGQRFAFNGYLPVNGKEAAKAIRDAEKESISKNQTQVFIETPYRNNQVLDHLLQNLSPSVRLNISIDLTAPDQYLKTRAVREWIKDRPLLPKRPAIFCFLAV